LPPNSGPVSFVCCLHADCLTSLPVLPACLPERRTWRLASCHLG
jgi:hypothetical protein